MCFLYYYMCSKGIIWYSAWSTLGWCLRYNITLTAIRAGFVRSAIIISYPFGTWIFIRTRSVIQCIFFILKCTKEIITLEVHKTTNNHKKHIYRHHYNPESFTIWSWCEWVFGFAREIWTWMCAPSMASAPALNKGNTPL